MSEDKSGADAANMDPGAAPEDVLRRSDQSTAGGMGVSSEREGHAGPGQHGTTGLRQTGPAGSPGAGSEVDAAVDVGELPPEFRPGAPETNPQGIPPKAGYPSLDPRSSDDS